MPENLELVSGVWWRFTAYRLKDGLIRPAPGAQLARYDPWEREDDRPYAGLIQLVESFKLRIRGSEKPYELDPDDEQRLLEWCSKHGLLGILPHCASRLRLAPRWERLLLSGSPDKPLLATAREYQRVQQGWLERPTQDVTRPRSDVPEGTVVAPEDRPATIPQPSVELQNLRDYKVQERGLDGLGPFFPDVPVAERENFPYPMPLSRAFWNMYSEPLYEFIQAARALRDALLALDRFKPEGMSEEDRSTFDSGLDLLHALTVPVGPALVIRKNGLQQRFACKSLLSTFAMMAMADLGRGVRMLRCAICPRIFTSTSPRALYCSTAHRLTAEKRRQRARQAVREGRQ